MTRQKKISIHKIAEYANVSPATVSRVINQAPNVNPETRENVNAAMQKLGFVPKVVRGNIIHIALLFLCEEARLEGYPSMILEGVMSYCSERDIELSVINLTSAQIRRGSDFIVKLLMERRCSGAVCLFFSDYLDYLPKIRAAGLPVVAIADRMDMKGIGCIDADNEIGTSQAMDYLISMGHKKIAIFCSTMESQDHISRLSAYRRSLEQAGLDVDQDLIIPLVPVKGSIRAGQSMARKFLASGKEATAIFCMTDELAIGAMNVFAEVGISVPEDISVIGYDGLEITEFLNPPLTTICQPAKLMGQKAVMSIHKAIMDNVIDTQGEILPSELIIRKSVAQLSCVGYEL